MSKKLPLFSARQVMKALAKVEFVEISNRGKGSHHFVFREDPPKGITIPDK